MEEDMGSNQVYTMYCPAGSEPLGWIPASTEQCKHSSLSSVMLTRSNTLQRVCYSTSMSPKKDAGPEIVSSGKRSSAPCLRPLQPLVLKVPGSSLPITCIPVFQGPRAVTQAPATTAQASSQP